MIALPGGVFKPYAGVSTAILLFSKVGETNDVWFYNMKADGFTLDDKRNKIAESDLPDIVQRYKERSTPESGRLDCVTSKPGIQDRVSPESGIQDRVSPEPGCLSVAEGNRKL